MRKCIFLIVSICFICPILKTAAQGSYQKMEPVYFSQVEIEDNFWKPRIKSITDSSIPVCIDQAEKKTAGIRNFEKLLPKKGKSMKVCFLLIPMFIR